MAMENESKKEKGIEAKELEEFFRSRFVSCDNLSRSVVDENACIMRERGSCWLWAQWHPAGLRHS